MATAQKIVGTIKARSPFGMIIEGKDEYWLNFSKDEYVIGPMDKGVQKGDRVELVVDGKYIISCQKAGDSHGFMDDAPPPEPPPEETPSEATGSTLWGYEQKDKLMYKMTCINAASAILTAEIAAGIRKNPVTPDDVHAFAEQLESAGWETFRG